MRTVAGFGADGGEFAFRIAEAVGKVERGENGRAGRVQIAGLGDVEHQVIDALGQRLYFFRIPLGGKRVVLVKDIDANLSFRFLHRRGSRPYRMGWGRLFGSTQLIHLAQQFLNAGFDLLTFGAKRL